MPLSRLQAELLHSYRWLDYGHLTTHDGSYNPLIVIEMWSLFTSDDLLPSVSFSTHSRTQSSLLIGSIVPCRIERNKPKIFNQSRAVRFPALILSSQIFVIYFIREDTQIMWLSHITFKGSFILLCWFSSTAVSYTRNYCTSNCTVWMRHRCI